jgi:hypothetical protein
VPTKGRARSDDLPSPTLFLAENFTKKLAGPGIFPL